MAMRKKALEFQNEDVSYILWELEKEEFELEVNDGTTLRLSKEEANEIINNPTLGADLALNAWIILALINQGK